MNTSNTKPVIGVLALQGAVIAHEPHVVASGATFKPVKTPADFKNVDGFILPGGESTTMLNLIERFNLWDALTEAFAEKPVWGICAGAILMAQTVLPEQKSFGLLPITVKRNAYGRQLDSHHDEVADYPVAFIRAPIIEKCDSDTKIIAKQNQNPVWVQKGRYMATTFHPELSLDFPSPMHKAFVDLIG